MKNKFSPLISALLLFGVLCWIYFTLMPRHVSDATVSLSEFSTLRAWEHVKEISKEPHYVGSENHKTVEAYLVRELQRLGLQTQIQQGTTLSDWGNLVPSRNILARIKGSGNGKALLLLSHYDSAPHSASHGAADDASGVAVILEGIRAFLHNKTEHKNDIIIVFSDAEELGLNGAALFVTQSQWAKDIGVALNFEARGTSGPGYMLMEVNNGNSAMVDAFSDAKTSYPASNSLMYSIYKMLPNDTDLTVFREQGQIQGFNFAFIDDHFNYHTAQDDIDHLSRETLAHQGSYLVPLLGHFSNSDLAVLNSDSDQVYFNTPIGFIHYSFSMNFVLLGFTFLLFLFLVFVGLGKRILSGREIARGFLPLLGSLLTSGMLGFFGWKLVLLIYPKYNDILQGFTYNGHWYIAAFVFLSLSVCWFFYALVKPENISGNFAVAPLLFWLLLNLALAIFLPGAAYFILPVFFALVAFGYYIVTQRSNIYFYTLCALPAFFVFVPFIVMFPIGLGLKILAGSSVLTALVFVLLLPLFGNYPRKGVWGTVFLLAFFGCVIGAHLQSDYVKGKAKPNSLLYVYDANADKAFWTTYDQNLDDWTKTYLGEEPKPSPPANNLPLFSKYNSGFTYANDAMVRDLPEPVIEFLTDSIGGQQRYIQLRITPQRPVNRYDIFANEATVMHNLVANGAKPLGQQGSLYKRKGKKILTYYVVDNQPLLLQFSVPKGAILDMELLEASFDLMKNPQFMMKKRADWMMPTPFVLNDAIVIRKKVAPSAEVIIPIPVRQNFSLQRNAQDTIPDPDSEIEDQNIQ